MEREVVKGMNNKPIKIIESINVEGKKYTDIYYDHQDRIVKRVETTVINDIAVEVYEYSIYYHWNGELASIKDSKGLCLEFDLRGLPIKK